MAPFVGIWLISALSFAGAEANAQSGEPAQLQAGVASIDITPSARLPMWGYSDRTDPAVGTLDPLWAKILVLQMGETRCAIVTLDLGRTPEEPQLDELKRRIQDQCGIDDLLVTASHTHQAPNLESYDDQPNEYVKELLPKLVKGVDAANGQLEPVRLSIARGRVDLAHNRRRWLPDGRVAMQWRNVERDRTEPVDSEFVVIRFAGEHGTLAVMVHYACHPVVLGSDHQQYSADYVGAMRNVVEKNLKTTCLFLQGACGDINPYVDKTPVAQGGVEAMKAVGKTLGEAVVEAVPHAVTSTNPPSLEFISEEVPARVRWDMSKSAVRETLSRAYGRRFDHFLAARLQPGVIPLRLTTVVINRDLALVGMPGEVFVQFQLDLKKRSPIPTTLLVGYTNGYHAYFPSIRDAAAGAYGGKTATYVAPGTAERCVDEAIMALYSLTGQLSDVPQIEDFQLLEWDDVKQRAAGSADGPK